MTWRNSYSSNFALVALEIAWHERLSTPVRLRSWHGDSRAADGGEVAVVANPVFASVRDD